MKSRRGGLGRGLGALIPTAPVVDGTSTAVLESPTSTMEEAPPSTEHSAELNPVPGANFQEIDISSVKPNPKQPRTVFDEESLDELKASITEVGVLQPIVVREVVAGGYELVMGERRLRACQAIGRGTIPAIIRDTNDDQMLRDALLENVHRSNLNPLEEAAAYQQLLAEFGVTQEELAQRIGKSRPQISNTIRLLNLPSPVQRRVAAGVLTAGHARAILTLENSDQQEDLARRIVSEGLSVRATEELVTLASRSGVGDTTPATPSRRAKPRSPGLEELAGRLSEHFDTRVKVDLGRRKGKIVIEFATVEDLERIASNMGIAPSQ